MLQNKWHLQHQDIARYILEHSKWSLQLSTDHDEEAEMRLTNFCADMTQLTMKTRLNLTDICNLLEVTGQLASTARQRQQQGLAPTTQQILHNLVKLLCKQLWTQRTHLLASNSAVTFTALSQTLTHPNTMPGLADALAEQFIADSECHNAYRYTQTLYACTQMDIDPCKGRLREHILQRFPKLSLANATPRMLTNMLYAVAAQTSPLSPAAADATALRTKAAHKLCTRLTRMLKSSKAEDQCTEDGMASSLCSLRTLKHKPTDDFTAAFADWYAQLLRQLQNVSPPQISCRLVTMLAACVDLRLKLPASLVPLLIPHIDGMCNAPAKAAACATSAWAAAALGVLDIQSLELILHAQRKHQQPWSELPWSVIDLLKLFQAVDWLQPGSADDPNCVRWRRLHDQVAAFGTRPVPGASAPQPMLSALRAVLDEFSVAISSNVHLGSFVAPALVKAQGKQEGAWVFDFMSPADFFTNDPERCVSAVVSACVCVLSVPSPSLCQSAVTHYLCLTRHCYQIAVGSWVVGVTLSSDATVVILLAFHAQKKLSAYLT